MAAMVSLEWAFPAGAQMSGCLGLCWETGRLSSYDYYTLCDLSKESLPVHLRLVRPHSPQWPQPPRPLPRPLP